MAEGDKTAPSEFVRVSPEEYASSLGGDSSEDHILEQIDAPVVLHGIHLKQKDDEKPFALFSYCPAPFMDAPVKVDWKILSPEAITGQHICYYQLQSEESLTEVLEHCQGYTRALLLVNSEEGYTLPQTTLQGQFPQPSFPVCVLSYSEGQQLLAMVEKHEVGDLFARVETTSLSDSLAKSSKSPTPEELTLSLQNVSKNRKLRIPFHKPRVDLKRKLKEIMTTPAAGPLCVSEDSTLFKKVMEEFNAYEQAAQSKHHTQSDNGRVFQKLIKFISEDEVFTKDYPFYLLLAYRVFKKQELYSCEELAQFIRKCIAKFEELVQNMKLDPLLQFIERGDFTVLVGTEQSSVFSMLEKAGILLLKESQKMKGRSGIGSQPHRSLFFKMIWLTLSLKFKSLTGPRNGSKVWFDHLTKNPECHPMDNQTIKDLVFGLSFGQRLFLPVEASFGMQQMGQLLVGTQFVRPFYHLSDFLLAVEPFLYVPEEFVEHLVSHLRNPYRHCLINKKLQDLSTYQNLLGAIQEGLVFLDNVYEIWIRKKWTHAQFDYEMLQWLRILLESVDITSEKAISYLKEFVTPATHKVTSKYKKQIERNIVAETRNNFSKMSVHRFSWLYKSFYIWDLQVVEDYLRGYHLPSKIDIKDKVWVEFFTEIVQRFGGAQNHGFILEFLILVADKYRDEKRCRQFVFDLLGMYIPGLFAVNDGDIAAARSVPITFQAFLREYIQRNHLTSAVVNHVTKIWKSIKHLSDFQLLILTVLQKELVPESRSLKEPVKESIRQILSDTVDLLSYDTSWLSDLNAHHRFAFGVVNVCCSRLPVSEELDWMKSYTSVVTELGKIFSTFCHHQGIDDSILTSMPAEVQASSSEDIQQYFQWVINVQNALAFWNKKFSQQSLNYDQMLGYLDLSKSIASVGKAVCGLNLVIDASVVEKRKNDFLQLFERLNRHLIKYIPTHPETGWLLLPELLREYGIEIPENISIPLSEQIVFPGEDISTYGPLMVHPLQPSITGVFSPGHDVCLQLTRDVVLKELSCLVEDLDKLLSPIQNYLELLVFFCLHKSAIFDTYLRFQLRENMRNVKEEDHDLRERIGSMSVSLFGSMRKVNESFRQPSRGIPWPVLQTSLAETQKLILNIVKGTARYNEITAGDTLMLDRMDVDAEFHMLANYTKHTDVDIEDFDGLRGIQCMLELFQYTHHINTIYSVCEQYHLYGCLKDSRLQQVKEIADELVKEGRRDQLTAKEATEMMQKIIKGLCLRQITSTSYDKQPLSLFQVVADSAMFYQFVKDKEFYGEEGQDLFRQQYDLITAQLQHEEYNEVVLNHLLTAFIIISPFLDDEQDFESLMMAVNDMKITTGRLELNTVNKNIHLVKLWFSRAEEDSLEMVPAELESILETGEYQFIFGNTPNGVKAELFLEYQPPILVPPMLSTSQLMLPDGISEMGDLTLNRRESAASEMQVNTLGLRKDTSPPPLIQAHRLTNIQIKDFEQRLGFLDPEDNIMENIKRFLMLNRNAYKLLDLFQRLRDLGQPSYIALGSSSAKYDQRENSTYVPFRVLSCSLSELDVLKKVEEAEQELSMWTLEVEDLHVTFENLLFFTIPKLLHIHRKMMDGSMEGIVSQITFLFKNNIIIREKLKNNVKALLPQVKKMVESCTAPMEVVGSFMRRLFEEYEMARYALHIRHPNRRFSRSLSTQANTILHSCHGFTTSQLMSLIINIYEGVPEAFLLFHCHRTTTEDELKLFLKRSSRHAFKFMIVSVERLPYQLQELLLQFQLKHKPGNSEGDGSSCLHFVETGPSVLREMPWILVKNHKDGIALNHEKAKKFCQQAIVSQEDYRCISLVYGFQGDGKTHYIQSKLSKKPPHMVLQIPVNESFTPLSAIKKLQKLANDTRGCCIYFNFTILPLAESSSKEEKKNYKELVNTINWFMFELLVLGYVEDPTTGASFRLPGGLCWAIYIEVPSRGRKTEPKVGLKQFIEDIPVLGLIGKPEYIDPRRPYVVNEDVQLVCKYLKAYKNTGKNGIDKLYKEPRKNRPAELVKFSLEKDLSEDDCHGLLSEFIPQHMKQNKTTQKLFVSYMKRRCQFLDSLPAYNYNTGGSEQIFNSKGNKVTNNTRKLGSTLMKAFLREVEEFCDPAAQADWSKKPHQQIIYDCVDGGASIGLISLHSEHLSEEERSRLEQIGIELPALMDLHSREYLDSYLSRALNVPLENGRVRLIDETSYVLTLDYTLKMLNIHERHECGMPVIIEGETGVGKTALVEILSKLWNYSHLHQWNMIRETLMETITKKMDDLSDISPERKQACIEIVTNLNSGNLVTDADLLMIAQLPDSHSPSAQFHSVLLEEVLKLKDNPVLSLLDRPDLDKKTFNQLFRAAEYRNNDKTTAELLYSVFLSQVKNTFHKLNVHAALKPIDVIEFFDEVIIQANTIEDAYAKCKDASLLMKIPSVTVFLDEVNTATCLGLFKEILVDKSIDGNPLPENVFVIAACNPHRGDSLAAMAQDGTWIRSNYYVRELHPTLEFLRWDYGALDEYQERDYINAKLRLIEKLMPNAELSSLAELLVLSQKLMRKFANEQLCLLGVEMEEAAICSKSSVSQRDIQRVFTFYEWFMGIYGKLKPYGPEEDYHRSAMMLALALSYYMRLDPKYRAKFREAMDNSTLLGGGLSFSENFARELNWYIGQMDIPKGVAKTQALKENMFANIVCSMTHTPLIIVGPPGCSKTLSFNLVTSNLRGQESKMKLFRDTALFQSLDPHYYQCSRRTTSNEIHTVFLRAINRQRSYGKVPLPIYCVVFMDEAGLPEESLESLKVLHYHLDRKEVSFIAISNHMLDAAKTNRAVSVYRPEPSIDELRTLAKGCLCSNPENPPPELKRDIDIVTKFCPIYHKFMEKTSFRNFYGLRDFIHFVNYLSRNRKQRNGINDKLVMHALERNFNGSPMFEDICREFLHAIKSSLSKMARRNILDILRDSLLDKPKNNQEDDEVRYKLIIDSSEDSSLLRLLFTFNVLKYENTRTYVCSDFPGDSHQNMINTVAAIRHSAAAGHTVLLSQTDEIHESFYDLFNKRFRRIDDPKTGPRYYSNISIGAHYKPCRVHSAFQCIVVVRQSEIKNIPPPFLNRFEKYSLTHKTLLEAVMNTLPSYLRAVIQRAYDKSVEFVEQVKSSSSLYGFHEDTLASLLLSLLPPVGHKEFLQTDKPRKEKDEKEDKRENHVFLLDTLLRALRKRAGFRLSHFTADELADDALYVINLVKRDSQFAGQFSAMSKQDILKVVPEALAGLYHTTLSGKSTTRADLSINACMIISVFLQWLVRHITKRLIQLMTVEAVTRHYKTLPLAYTEAYLKHQSHFHLKTLVEKQLQVMELDDQIDRSTTGTASRLLCITRSSALIHQFPAQYPSASSFQLASDYESLIKRVVFSHPQQVMVYKISSATSQATVKEALKAFERSRYDRVMVLVVNMAETTPDMVSHLRVLIEEADTGLKLKLFVMLLHFPPDMFNRHCYPTLFTNTWDHHYLDVVGQNTTGQVFDICEWFTLCCKFLSSQSKPLKHHISMHLGSLLQEAIPIISSRVFFGENKNAFFNIKMDLPQRKKILQELFEMGIGDILCDKFLKYWEPGVMLEYLEKAGDVTIGSQTTTLSITDSVQSLIKDTFFDFVVYIISTMNEDMNIDILFDPDTPEYTHELFFRLLKCVPVPRLSQLKTLSSFSKCISHAEGIDETAFTPKFPFFRFVSSSMEKIIDQSRKELNQRLDTLHQNPEMTLEVPKVIEDKSHLVTLMKEHVDFVLAQYLESDEDSLMKVAIEAMMQNEELYTRYNEAFTHNRLRLGSSTVGLSYRILKLAFMQLNPDQNILSRFALLHICVHVYQLDLARLVQVMRPLDNLLDLASNVPDDPFHALTSPSPTASFLSSIKESGGVLGQPGDLSSYVLKILFSALLGTMFGENPEGSTVQHNLGLWYRVYRDVLSMSTVKDYLYKNLSELAETQHHIMHATFLVIQCNRPGTMETLAIARKVFTTLFNSHLTKQMEVTAACPRISEIAKEIIQEISNSTMVDANQKNEVYLQMLIEGLFAHFFSTHRTSYHTLDCKWLLELINQNLVLSSSVSDIKEMANEKELSSFSYISAGVYKLYLARILGATETSDGLMVSYPALYKPNIRTLVGSILTAAQPNAPVMSYIPIFYQDYLSEQNMSECQSPLMQQPLANLYFIMVLEHIESNSYQIQDLVRAADAMQQDLEEDTISKEERVLKEIEKQAMIQGVMRQLAKHLNPAVPQGLSAVSTIVHDINQLLCNKCLEEVYGMTLSMHLLKELKSYGRFSELLSAKYSSYHKDFTCLSTVSVDIQQLEECHLFPFLVAFGKGNILKDLYERVSRAMLTAHTSQNKKIGPLISVTEDWNRGQVLIALPDGQEVQGERYLLFRMILWLVIYYKFYCLKKSSTVLVELLTTQDQIKEMIPSELNKLMCCFLDPSKMTQAHTSTAADTVYLLFNTDEDIPLRHALASLIAVVVASPPKSSHLWYNIFSPDKLFNTLMPGFLYGTPVGNQGLFYDEGTQLTESGFYSKMSYLKHATRGTLSLQSAYLVLWASYGAFCVGLLTNNGADDKMVGNVFPDGLPLRQHCVEQLRAMWGHLSNSLGISVEERSYLVAHSMWNLLKISCGSSILHGGIFTQISNLNNYESIWHNSVFMPVWRSLKDDFAKFSRLFDDETGIFNSIRSLQSCYPCFTTVDTLKQALLSNPHISSHTHNYEYLLACFVLQYQQLELGGSMLPDLVEFYQWIHLELAHVITQEDAAKITLRRAVRVLAKSYSCDEGERFLDLYSHVKDEYNKYAALAVRNLVPIDDSTPLLYVLSFGAETDHPYDFLYAAISDIINTHNDFITKSVMFIQSDKDSLLYHYLPDNNLTLKVHPTEFTTQNCVVEKPASLQGLTEYVQMIRSRSALFSSPSYSDDTVGGSQQEEWEIMHSTLPGQQTHLVDLQQLQEDVVISHIVGKPLIEPPSSFRYPFHFRNSIPHSKKSLSAIEADLETISEKLYDEFKYPMDSQTAKSLELHFHASTYQAFMNTISGLRSVAAHLIKSTMSGNSTLSQVTVASFLIDVLKVEELSSSISVLREIGIHSLSPDQFKILDNLKLHFLYDALGWFVRWVSHGWCEFYAMPYSMKTAMNLPDLEALNNLPEQYTGSVSKLLSDIEEFVMVLTHLESTSRIISHVEKDPQMAIVNLVSAMGMCTEQEELLGMIPETVTLQNYVALRVVLKQMIDNLKKQISSDSVSKNVHHYWDDFVDDLWSTQLTQFRHDNYTYAVVSTGDKKKRVYSLQNINRSDEDLLNDLMTAGVSESDLLPDTDVDTDDNSLGKSDIASLQSLGDAELNENNTMKRETAVKKRATSYTTEALCAFLEKIGLEVYTQNFEDFDITGDTLLDAGQNLSDLGITNPLHSLQINVLFKRELEGVGQLAKRFPVEEVGRFLHSIKMSEYVKPFEEHKIDGEILMEASEEVLEVLGVKNHIQRLTIKNRFGEYIIPRYTTL